MFCLYCLHPKTSIPNSRPHKKRPQVWRRRQCSACKRVFTTYERPSLEDVTIINKGIGTQQTFSIGQLAVSIYESMSHRPSAANDSYELARTIEYGLIHKYDIETPLSTKAIAKEAYIVLKRYDELVGLQYGARYGLIASIRRRGRPSTTATNDDVSPAHD